MKTLTPVFLLLACTLTATLAPAFAREDPLHTSGVISEVQPIGWNADETKLALRFYELTPDYEGSEDEPFCAGYVNHKGEKFKGALSFVVYEVKGTRVQPIAKWPVQSGSHCTPPAEAKRNLETAKKKIASLGIDLTKPGTLVRADENKAGEIELINDFEESEDPSDESRGTIRVTGTSKIVRIHDGKKTELTQTDVNTTYSQVAAGSWSLGLEQIHFSPSKKRVVVVTHDLTANMRGMEQELRISGVFPAD